jgi:hypothetical protein
MIRTIRFTTVGAMLLASSSAAYAQTDAAGAAGAAPPGEEAPIGCLISARKFETDAYQAAQATKAPFDGQAVHAQAIERAKQCGAKFNVETMDPAQRAGLGMLYMATGDVARAKTVLARVEGELPNDTTARVTTLMQLLQAYGGNSDQTAAVADCQRVVQRLDSTSGMHSAKLAAHGSLVSWANNADLDALARDNVAAILALVPSLTPDEQRANAKILVNAYSTRAVHQANALRPDSALLTIAAAQKTLSAVPDIASAFTADVQRYSMIGKPAPAVYADYWINKPAGPLKGAATVLLFTANWCHSCKTSYPSIVTAMKTYPATDLQTVFLVNLDGQFQGVQMTPAQEVEANRKYFVTEHGFTNSIAIQRSPNGDMQPPDSASNAQSYAMNYLPQVVVIDKQGIVRAFLQGWDEAGNREQSFKAALKAALGK